MRQAIITQLCLMALLLLWEASRHTSGYHVYSKSNLSDSWQLIGTTTNTQWPLTIDGPMQFYTVSAFNGSVEVFAEYIPTTLQPNYPPEQPTK